MFKPEQEGTMKSVNHGLIMIVVILNYKSMHNIGKFILKAI